jgi:hypothetical protein
MSLAAIFDAVSGLLPANVKKEIGAAAVFGEDGAPRVVWVPVSERIASSRGHGGDSSAGMHPGTASLATREVTCECHVWAPTMELTEDLRDLVHNALQQLIWGAFQITDARWVNNEGQTVKHGHAYVMSVIIQVPVLRPAEYKLHVTAFTQACEMQFLNGDVEVV